MAVTPKQLSGRKNERGSVTIMTAVLMVGLVLVIGLCIDVSRIYMARAGLQNAADAAALAAARELNSGTSGLADAVTQAMSANLTNKYGFNRTGVTPPNVTIVKVEFSNSLAAGATWYDNTNGNTVPAGTEASIRYVRVTTQSAVINTLFAGRTLGASHTEQRTAIAGASVGLTTVCNFFPIAVALSNPYPTNGAQLTFNFTNVSSTTAVLVDKGYVVLEIPEIPGNGLPETAKLAAGITSMSATIGGNLRASPSANGSNGPRAIADGANMRFDLPANGYGSGFNATNYPPDTNTAPALTSAQYLNKSLVVPPPFHPPGQDDRRILVMPILPIGTYARTAIPTVRFGAFLLRSPALPNGDFLVEYLGDSFPIGCGSYDPSVVGTSTLSKPVLYR